MGEGKTMKFNKVIAIPAIAIAAGIGLAACGSVKAPVAKPTVTVTHTVAAKPVPTKTTHSAKPKPVQTTPKAVAAPPVAAAPTPVLNVRNYSGIKPGVIAFSGDGGYVITGIVWSSWGPTEADGTGTSNIQGCVPDCATGSETPYTDTIVLSDVQGGQFTQVNSTRDGTVTAGSTSLILGAEQNSPDAAPAAPALTACGEGLTAGAGTSCSFAADVARAYHAGGYWNQPGTSYFYVDGQSMTSASVGNPVIVTDGSGDLVQFND